jgi:hypothetical protein
MLTETKVINFDNIKKLKWLTFEFKYKYERKRTLEKKKKKTSL